MPAAAIGHNSSLTPAEARALYMHHFGKIAGQRALVKAAQALEKTMRKEAKVDGLVLRDIDFGLRCNDVDDDSIIPAELVRHHEIARWLGLPVGTQSEFNFKRDTSIAAAKREGAAAGYSGSREPPYEAGTPEEQEWLKAYDGAQAQARDDLLTAMQKKSEERLQAARRAKKPDDDDDDEEDDEAA